MLSHYLTPFGAKGSSGTIVAQNHDLNGTEIIGGLHQGDYSKSCYLIPLGNGDFVARGGDGGLGISITVTAVGVLHEAKESFCGINEPWRRVDKGSEACGPKKRPAIERDTYQDE